MNITKNNGDTSFPNILRLLRKNKGWSQGQLAQKAGIDLQKFSKYERANIVTAHRNPGYKSQSA